MKNRQLDLLIVVNMFLTGFDAPTLNTLWVDKNLKQHGLIQAYSRTNRILNDVKTHGNIVCFRDLSSRTEEAIKLFSDDEATRIVLMRTFNDFYYGYDENGKHYDGYKDCVNQLTNEYPLPFTTIFGEEKEKAFIKLFSKIIRLENILNSFENFDDKKLLNERDRCNYLSYYLTMKDKYQTERGSFAADVTDSLEFETEIIDHFDINVDYILNLLDQEKMNQQEADKIGHDVSAFVLERIDSSPNLRSKKELIRNFLDVFNVSEMTTAAWEEYIASKKKRDLDDIIYRLNLVPEKTISLMDDMLAQHQFVAVGERFGGIVRASLFGGKDKKLKEAEAELRIYFDRYHDIILR
jgi:type I restriction enzyme R subunit